MASSATNWKPVRYDYTPRAALGPAATGLGGYSTPSSSTFASPIPRRTRISFHPSKTAIAGTIGALGGLYAYHQERKRRKKARLLTTFQGRKLRPSFQDIVASERLS